MKNIVYYSKENMISEDRFNEMYGIIEEAFPASERHSKEEHFAEFSEHNFHSMCYQPDIIAAIMNYWEFDSFIYVEHFAVSKHLRGNGIGAELMQEFKKIIASKPIILEAEPPEMNSVAERRVAFYERLGFSQNNYEYWQPSMQNGEPPVALIIMSLPSKLSPEEYLAMKGELYKFVYKVDENYHPMMK